LAAVGCLIAPQLAATILTVNFKRSLSTAGLNVNLAGSVSLAVALIAFQPTFQIIAERACVVGQSEGTLSGSLGRITSPSGPVIITYLMALGLTREKFVSSISVICLGGSLPLYSAMAWHGHFGWMDVGLSCLALLPMAMGLRLGKSVRRRLNE